MIWIHYTILWTLVASCWGETDINNEITPKNNEKLDGNLRKALLKALNELQSDQSKTRSDVQKLVPSLVDLPPSAVFQKPSNLSVSTVKPSTTTSTTQPTTEKVTRPVVVVQKSSGYQHKPITTIINTVKSSLDPINDSEYNIPKFISSGISFTTRSPKYEPSKNVGVLSQTAFQFNKPNIVSITEKSRITQAINPTTIPTIITPSTEEYQAKVENIQFFQAPLVAAFTVHHDSIGFPQSIEPIYRTSSEIPVTVKSAKQTELLRQKQETEKYKKEQIKLQQYLGQQEQIRIQNDLAQKQTYLEQQIKILQQQRQHQDYLLRQQQLLQEQQLLQQRQALINEQKTLYRNSHDQPTNLNKNNRFVQNHVGGRDTNSHTAVSFQPSISFQQSTPQIHNTLLPPFVEPQSNNFLNTQFPPSISKPVNFHQNNLIPQNQQSFKNSQSFAAISKFNNQVVQHNRYKNFDVQPQTQKPITAQPIRGLQGLDLPQKIPENNRVIRHELGTGNFVNNNYNNYNNYNPIQQQPQNLRYFRSNANSLGTPNDFSNYYSNQNFVASDPINSDLNKLLLYSGINLGKQEEDLSIVSKVLSLNHLGANNYYIKPHNYNQRIKPSYRGF